MWWLYVSLSWGPHNGQVAASSKKSIFGLHLGKAVGMGWPLTNQGLLGTAKCLNRKWRSLPKDSSRTTDSETCFWWGLCVHVCVYACMCVWHVCAVCMCLCVVCVHVFLCVWYVCVVCVEIRYTYTHHTHNLWGMFPWQQWMRYLLRCSIPTRGKGECHFNCFTIGCFIISNYIYIFKFCSVTTLGLHPSSEAWFLHCSSNFELHSASCSSGMDTEECGMYRSVAYRGLTWGRTYYSKRQWIILQDWMDVKCNYCSTCVACAGKQRM